MAVAEFQVTGMACAHCEMSVREEVSEVVGVQGVEVSATTGKLLVSMSEPVDDAAVVLAVQEAGYRAVRV